MSKIKSIMASEILDSRKNPTIHVKVDLDSKTFGEASVPKGKSTGAHEAAELRSRDGHVVEAVNNIKKMIEPALIGKDPTHQQEIDQIMIKLDDTKNKANLGANAILGVSLAVSRAAAQDNNLPLYKYLAQILNRSDINKMPTPMFNFINGGAHGQNNLQFQEYLIIPQKFQSFAKKLDAGKRIFEALKNILVEQKLPTNLGDEGGFIPNLASNETGLDLLTLAIKRGGFQPAEVEIGLDVAASEFYKDDHYFFEGQKFESYQMIDYFEKLAKEYPLKTLEDGLSEDDWTAWNQLTMKLGDQMLIIGDDLFTTNLLRVERGIRENCANAVLVKPNQIGSLSETLDVIAKAQKSNLEIVISHRSGETMDPYIADLAVACQAKYLKSGSVSQQVRLAKYNRLAEIEKELSK